jgi:hypothetical protein
MKQLDRLLFEQGGDCFFCGNPLAKADASIEHLYAQANGGTNAEENVVACCKGLNALLGHKPLKEKFQVVLRQRGSFRCPLEETRARPSVVATPGTKSGPQPKNSSAPKTPSPNPSVPRLALAVPAPRPLPAQAGAAQTSAVQCPTCKHAVSAAMGQVDYLCGHCGGAFRY